MIRSSKKTAKKRRAETKTCVECGQVFTRRPSRVGKFCSPKCYFKKIARDREQATRELVCAFCKTSFTRTSGFMHRKQKRVFCSSSCSHQYHTGSQSQHWRGGTIGWRGVGWKRICQTVRDRDGNICRWCGKSSVENGRALSVDHVRPWRECESEAEANRLENLVSLCLSCHGKKFKIENAWLRGDGLALQQYRQFVGIINPTVKAEVPVPAGCPRLLPLAAPPDYAARGAAISLSKKKYYANPGVRAEWSEIAQRTARSPERIEKLRTAALAQWSTPGMRESMSAAMKVAKRR